MESTAQVGRVFLSHTSADKPLVRRLAADLQSRRVGVWFDEWEMKVGDSLVERIEAGIREAGFLAIVLSEKSVQSQWVRRELNAALAAELERRSVFILPLLAEDCDMPLFLRDKLYADFRYDYSDGLRAVLRTVSPGASTPPKIVFDSSLNDRQFATWGVHFSDRRVLENVAVEPDVDDQYQIAIHASSDQSIGLNKSVPTLHGRAEFEYFVDPVSEIGDHVFFAMLPIQETGYDRTGVIEVGGTRQADPRNPTSPWRIRFSIPAEHQSDGLWHLGVIDFDFRDTPTAFYAILAARINEGAERRRALPPVSGKPLGVRMQPYLQRLQEFVDGHESEIFLRMEMWAQNELLPQVRHVNRSPMEVALFLLTHSFIQTFMDKTYALSGRSATESFLRWFMDGKKKLDRFSLISAEIHAMRNVMAHQMYSGKTHEIAFDYTMTCGWAKVPPGLRINPKIYGDQFEAAIDGGRIMNWRRHTTKLALVRQKYRFICKWLDLAKQDALRVAIESMIASPTVASLRKQEKIVRKSIRVRYGI